MRRKCDLPSKKCAACGRPFVWRRKWKAVWSQVKFCSERCRKSGDEGARPRRTDRPGPSPGAKRSNDSLACESPGIRHNR
ncbi:DUF2256 domain-containing protein [Stappia sp. ES.058]|uniref:DUF2256 domain-containing protein n=1 Tax=Stappia sp. ES.058 TaxID=1881061 RepID=UPI000B87A71A